MALDSGRTAARLLAERDRIDDANQQWSALASAFSEQPQWDEILDEWAFVNLKSQRYDDADQIYEQLLKNRPDSPFAGTARLALAESRLVANATTEARREFEAIVDQSKYSSSDREKALFHLITIDAEENRIDWGVSEAERLRRQQGWAAPALVRQCSEFAPMVGSLNTSL